MCPCIYSPAVPRAHLSDDPLLISSLSSAIAAKVVERGELHRRLMLGEVGYGTAPAVRALTHSHAQHIYALYCCIDNDMNEIA